MFRSHIFFNTTISQCNCVGHRWIRLFKMYNVDSKRLQGGTAFVYETGQLSAGVCGRQDVSISSENDCFSPFPVCDWFTPQDSWPGDREWNTLLQSFWSISGAGNTSFLDSSQAGLYLFVTLIFLQEWKPSEELNDTMSDTWPWASIYSSQSHPPLEKRDRYLKPWKLPLFLFSIF